MTQTTISNNIFNRIANDGINPHSGGFCTQGDTNNVINYNEFIGVYRASIEIQSCMNNSSINGNTIHIRRDFYWNSWGFTIP